MDIAKMMLEVLDDPTGLRIVAETECPLLGGDSVNDHVYFMIDRGCPETYEGANDAKIFDAWQITDNMGNMHEFAGNIELMNFFENNGGIFTRVYIEGF